MTVFFFFVSLKKHQIWAAKGAQHQWRSTASVDLRGSERHWVRIWVVGMLSEWGYSGNVWSLTAWGVFMFHLGKETVAVLLFDEVKLVTSGYLADCQSSLNLSPRKCDNQLKWRPQMDTSSNHFMLLMPLHQWSIGKITWGGLWRWATDWWCSRTGWGVFSQYLQVRRTNDPD